MTRGPATRDGRIRFLRFCAVGAIGFLVDAGVLLLVVGAGLMDPLPARLLSFGLAVFVTFNLNLHWSFHVEPRGPTSYLGHLAAYLGVQGSGFLCNLAVYAVALAVLPAPLGSPVACLALASASALLLNYLGAELIVFRRDRS